LELNVATKKKIVSKKTKTPADRVVAAVEFVLGADGFIEVRSTSKPDCPEQTRHAADIAAHLLFKECQRGGAVAVRLGDRVVLADPVR
jgi:hypothetical protein